MDLDQERKMMELAKREEEHIDRPTMPVSERSDAQIAEDYRDALLAVLSEVTGILNDARQNHGMIITFGYAPVNQFGRQDLATLEILKKLV